MVGPQQAQIMNLDQTEAAAPAPAWDASLLQAAVDASETLDSAQWQQVLDAWEHDASFRQDWHGQHMVGEALRSQVHVSSQSGADFLHEFRQRRDLPLADQTLVKSKPVKLSAAAWLPKSWRSRLGAWGAPALAAVAASALTILMWPTISVQMPTPLPTAVQAVVPAVPSTTATPADSSGVAIVGAESASGLEISDLGLQMMPTAEFVSTDGLRPLREPRYGQAMRSAGWMGTPVLDGDASPVREAYRNLRVAGQASGQAQAGLGWSASSVFFDRQPTDTTYSADFVGPRQ